MSVLSEAQSRVTIFQETGRSATADASSYIPVLDGVRGVSIALVIAGHLMIYEQGSAAIANLGRACGATGVSMFFVLSGYLITRLLVMEESAAGAVNLKHFYIRRFLRIIPAAYTFLVALVLLHRAGMIAIPTHDFVASFLYFRNVVGRAHETSHLWSLAIEEQFYLLWPPLMAMVAARSRIKMLFGLLGGILIWRSTLMLLGLVSAGTLYARTDMRMDTILVGCLLALMDSQASYARWTNSLGTRPLVLYGATAGLAGWAVFGRELPWGGAIDSTVTALLIALVLNCLIKMPRRMGARLLQTRPALFVGRLSYSLYLWQQLFLGPQGGLGFIRSFPLNVVLAFLASFGSYQFIEKPAMRLKRRWGLDRLRQPVAP